MKLASLPSERIAAEGNHKGEQVILATECFEQGKQRGHCCIKNCFTCLLQNTENTIARFCRGTRRSGGVGSGRPVCPQNCPPGENPFCLSKSSRTRRPNVSPEAQTSEVLCKPNGNTKITIETQSLTCLSPRREGLFLPGCWPIKKLSFVFENPFHARHVWEKQPSSDEAQAISFKEKTI